MKTLPGLRLHSPEHSNLSTTTLKPEFNYNNTQFNEVLIKWLIGACLSVKQVSTIF